MNPTVTLATLPAGADRPNEDFAAATEDVLVVVDGAGTPNGNETGCVHGVAWYARQLGLGFFHRASVRDQTLEESLAAAIESVTELHRDTCDPYHPGTPSATVTAVRIDQDRLEYLALADSPLVIRRHDSIEIITDARVDEVGDRYRHAIDATPMGSPERLLARRAFNKTMREHRNQPGGFWVASNDPRVAHEAVTGARDIADVQDLALLSDGASRLVDLFGLATWAEALDLIGSQGPAALIGAVRDAEASDPAAARWPRGKATDDATAIYARLR